MSRLDDALDAIEKAVGELASAIQDHEAKVSASANAQNGVDASSGIDKSELRAMKSELHEAMSLLHAMQDAPIKPEGQ